MEKLVDKSKMIYFSYEPDEKHTIIEMKLGNEYTVKICAQETGNTVCKFTSELESITIEDDWMNKKDFPDGFIVGLTFRNGAIIDDPQYNRSAVSISGNDEDMD